MDSVRLSAGQGNGIGGQKGKYFSFTFLDQSGAVIFKSHDKNMEKGLRIHPKEILSI